MRTVAVSARGKGRASESAFAIHRTILRVALALSVVFAWIFVFQFFYGVAYNLPFAIVQTAFLYALSSAVVCIATPLGARSLRHGTHHALFTAVFFCAIAFFSLGALFAGAIQSAYIPATLTVFAIALGLYRAYYWVPYQVELDRTHTHKRSTGVEIIVAFSPLVAGLFIASSAQAPEWLLWGAAIGVVMSAVSLPHILDVHERFSWNYRQTYHHLVAREHRSIAVRAFCEGVSGGALLFFWPLAIFLITDWSYGMLGIVLTLSFLVAIFARGLVRRGIRAISPRGSKLLTGTLAVTPWLLRMGVATPLGAILVDSYFYTTTPHRLGVDPFVFEQASDGGSFLDEYTALKEISLAFGRVVVCILGALVVLATSVSMAFVIVFLVAAITSGIVALKDS